MTRAALVVLAVALASGGAACRAGDPDPRTPPNSPLPEIDRPKDPEPTLPSPLSKDAGTPESH